MKMDIKKNKLTKKYKLTKRYPLFVLNKKIRYHKKLARGYDKVGYISMQLGKELEELWDDDYVIGIHRTGYSNANEIIQDVFTNGLINNGDSMLGCTYTKPDEMINLEKTVSVFSDLKLLVWQLKTASGYKESQGSFVIKIPKSYLGQAEGEIKPIYYKENGLSIRLLPEYIYGYVPCDNCNLGEMIARENIEKGHSMGLEQGLVQGQKLERRKKNIELITNLMNSLSISFSKDGSDNFSNHSLHNFLILKNSDLLFLGMSTYIATQPPDIRIWNSASLK